MWRANEIEKKAKKVMGMLKRGVKFMPTQPNVIAILEKLKQGKFNSYVMPSERGQNVDEYMREMRENDRL